MGGAQTYPALTPTPPRSRKPRFHIPTRSTPDAAEETLHIGPSVADRGRSLLVLRRAHSPVVSARIAVCGVDESGSGAEEEGGLEDVAELHAGLLYLEFYLSGSEEVVKKGLDVEGFRDIEVLMVECAMEVMIEVCEGILCFI